MKREVLQPMYFEEFTCIGAACEDTCCAGWKVAVDKKSFHKYRKVTSGVLAQTLQTNITRERVDPSDETYAKIKLDEKGNCAFLNENKLCNIYIELGESYLCHTCTTYPRQVRRVDNRIEKSLAPSCPEAARLLLLNPEGIDFTLCEEEVDETFVEYIEMSTLFEEIRMFAIQILQSRHTSIEHRIVVLGMFLEKMHMTSQQEWEKKIPLYTKIYTRILQDAERRNLFKELPDTVGMIEIAYALIQNQESVSVRFRECLMELQEGLQLLNEEEVEHSIYLYESIQQEYYVPFFEQHSYILENYLVNCVFKDAVTSNFYFEYQAMRIRFLYMKVILMGMASYHQTLSKEMVIKLIQATSKTFETNQAYRDGLKEILKEY
ncbi:flagellin lysine-N-methylase [Lysinibacillus sp. OTC-L20]|uniref:flagellin lysine-N-methylase n=1 Tax=Lysinibacillus sp. OTC-L20 TaxID=3342791 RepID=UPI0035BB8DFB